MKNFYSQFSIFVVLNLFLISSYSQTQSVNGNENYPNKSIRLIVPFSPASASDILARTISEKLQNTLGQPIIIENKPGAGGTIATSQVAKAEPDGYTLLIVSTGHVVNPSLYKNLSYDTLNDLTGIAPLASLPSVLVVQGLSEIKNVSQLIEFIKLHPGEINYVSGGVGSASHMNAEKFLYTTQIKATHIPLKGASDMAVEIIAGRSQFGFMPIIAALPFIKDGKLKALAVSTNQRSNVLPSIPTIIEAGHPGGEFNFWIGMIAPAKTPKKIVQKLNEEISKIILDPSIKERFAKLGAEPMILSPEKFDQFMNMEYKSLGIVLKQANVKME